MEPEYKPVAISVTLPHCPVCKERISDEHMSIPWRCKCGIWTSSPKDPWNKKYDVRHFPDINTSLSPKEK